MPMLSQGIENNQTDDWVATEDFKKKIEWRDLKTIYSTLI